MNVKSKRSWSPSIEFRFLSENNTLAARANLQQGSAPSMQLAKELEESHNMLGNVCAISEWKYGQTNLS